MTKDTGDWLSAEQAVLPDGTERGNLSLINKKLPALADTVAADADTATAAPAAKESCCGCGRGTCGSNAGKSA